MGKETNAVKLDRVEIKIDALGVNFSNHLKHHEKLFFVVLGAGLSLLVGLGLIVIPGLF